MLAIHCAVRAFGVVRGEADALAALRKQPGPWPRQRIAPTLLRHSDEQTVVALAAVLAAAERFALQGTDFTAWGAVAAPRLLGRLQCALALHRAHSDGVWAVSPMAVPHLSLHAVSGTISQALRIHGPNFGVSSGRDNVAEGLLAALTLLSDGRLPGAWLTLTQWEPEPVPDEEGRNTIPGVCHAVALALAPAGADHPGPRLRFHPPAAARAVTGPPAEVPELAAYLLGLGGTALPSRPDGSGAPSHERRGPWTCAGGGGGLLELTGVPGAEGALENGEPALQSAARHQHAAVPGGVEN